MLPFPPDNHRNHQRTYARTITPAFPLLSRSQRARSVSRTHRFRMACARQSHIVHIRIFMCGVTPPVVDYISRICVPTISCIYWVYDALMRVYIEHPSHALLTHREISTYARRWLVYGSADRTVGDRRRHRVSHPAAAAADADTTTFCACGELAPVVESKARDVGKTAAQRVAKERHPKESTHNSVRVHSNSRNEFESSTMRTSRCPSRKHANIHTDILNR